MESLVIIGAVGTTLGIDIGSTTAKIVLIEDGKLVYEKYERHFSQVRSKTAEMIGEISHLIEGKNLKVAVSGSAGLGIGNRVVTYVNNKIGDEDIYEALAMKKVFDIDEYNMATAISI